jgi:hypothetical protein
MFFFGGGKDGERFWVVRKKLGREDASAQIREVVVNRSRTASWTH